MRILVVASYNKGCFAPFVNEQAEALMRAGCEVEFFGVQGKGLKGYLNNLPLLKKRIKEFSPNVIHAHYGMSGLLANLQRKVHLVTTYHGSDINDKRILPFSKMAMQLSAWNIFVSQKTLEIAKPKRDYSLLPCGIDLTELQLIGKSEARRKMKLSATKKYILFAGAYDNAVKNAALAKEVVALMHDEKVEMLELRGYTREEVTLLMCACDVFLMTSFTEGSPQVIKEALACGCPIVSVDVGDVKERIKGVAGCYVSEAFDCKELLQQVRKAFCFEGKTDGRERVIKDGLDNNSIAKQMIEIYNKVTGNC